ncbi:MULTISPECIES: hypothetical protein [Ramlibacter]|uniref:Uncharacterized protein n=1 Tax=Ramlibacter aquaticus TaxID=2780094 RepID=A0ABR9SGH1_9BURK|nr:MULTISPECIES: hypothetical protein [Ramlibacter]MBE7941152.1 hypothetical protein [Ramlibacter aquaticus]
MSGRVGWCLGIAVGLAVVSPALLALGGFTAGDVGVVQWWFFAIPEQLETLLGTPRNARLAVYLACYAFQYFTVLYLLATALYEIQRPRGIEAKKAFEEAVTRFHED